MPSRIYGPLVWRYAKPNHVLVLDHQGDVIAEIPDPFAHLVCPRDLWDEPTEADIRFWEERCGEIWEDLCYKYPAIRCLAEMVVYS